MARTLPTNRRSVLQLAAGASLSALAGCTNLRVTRSEPAGEDPITAFELAARAGSWRGVAPEQIRGDRNPILRMAPGDSIELTWTNRDGERHRFIVEDSLGNTLVETEESAERGATRTVAFDAAQEMMTYVDPHHHVMMRGEILVTT